MTRIAWSLVSFATLAMRQSREEDEELAGGYCRRNGPSGGRNHNGLRRDDTCSWGC